MRPVEQVRIPSAARCGGGAAVAVVTKNATMPGMSLLFGVVIANGCEICCWLVKYGSISSLGDSSRW